MKTTLALAAISAALSVPSAAGAGNAELIYAGPGEDCSTQVRFSWHADAEGCLLACAGAGDARFARSKKVPCRAERTPDDFTGGARPWRCSAELDGLRPGTKYIYKVVSPDGSESPVQSFATAPASGAFSFLWMGDVHSDPRSHAKMDSVERLVADGERLAANGGVSFVLFSGDAVKRGKSYPCWQEWNGCRAAADYLFAAIPGNKEYYGDKGKKRRHNKWFCSVHNTPPNGAPGLASTYWFTYCGVLFVGVDTLAQEGTDLPPDVREGALRRQQAWFDKVATERKGRFQYLVVFQHYPYFKKDGPCDWGGYAKWSELFDRHGVDFALSGDSHSYVRSRPLRGGEARDGGTVYMVCPEIDSRLSAPRIKEGEALVAAYDDRSASYGACLFDVDAKSMRLRYVLDGKAYDSVSVKAKRPPAPPTARRARESRSARTR